MKVDAHQCVVMEKDGWPGDVGDSCAETCRLAILSPFHRHELDTFAFFTGKGFLRHPSLAGKKDWDEADFSVDQGLPLVLANELYVCWWRIPGTRTLVTPGLWFASRCMWKCFALTLLIQGLLFALPWRWSDEKKWFERNSSSSADYLNYFVGFIYLRDFQGMDWPMRFMRPETLSKIESYYANQPNSEWFVEAYRVASRRSH